MIVNGRIAVAVISVVFGLAGGGGGAYVHHRFNPPRPDPYTGSQAAAQAAAIRELNDRHARQIEELGERVRDVERNLSAIGTSGPTEVRKSLDDIQRLLEQLVRQYPPARYDHYPRGEP